MRDYPWATLAFSPDGTILAVSANGLIEIWDVLTSELKATISGGPGGVGELLFSPDGTQLVSTGLVKFWDVSEWSGPPLVTTIPPAGICGRTEEVQAAILDQIDGISDCALVTDAHLAAITSLPVENKSITALKVGDFDGLTALITLKLGFNDLSSLPEGVFDGFTALTTLDLAYNDLSSLPEDVFDRLTALTSLYLSSNELSSLPDGIFVGLTELTSLSLGGNTVNPLPLTISLEKVGDDQFKAVAPAGAPFEMVLPIRVTNGSITGGATTLTIPAGSVESEVLTVTPTPGTTGAVTVNIGTLPSLPSNHGGYTLAKSADLPLSYALPEVRSLIGNRTPQVKDAIVAAVPGVDNAADVTETHLAAITSLWLAGKGIATLKAGDFDGLTSLKGLNLGVNQLMSLPADVFSGLSSLTTLELGENRLTSLPADVFSGLSSLTTLELYSNQLTSLPANVFNGLSSLTTLELSGNQLTSLPADVFSGLSSVTEINLDSNRLTSLPADVFSGLSSLTKLVLSSTAVNPLPLIVSLEKVGTGQFKAVAPTGAPFDLILPLTVTNGSITSGAESITIPIGSVESGVFTVTRTPGTTFIVTVDIGTLPDLPFDHHGYALVKSADLPLAFPELGGRERTPVSERTPQVRDAIVRAVQDVNSASDVTETHLAAITSLTLSRFTNITTLKAGDFDGLIGLTSLDLSENQLSTLPEGIFDDLTALTLLELHDNQFSTLPADIFDELAKLRELHLYNNQIATLPAGTFDGLTWLDQLFLQGNQLTTIPPGIFDKLTGLRNLNLEDNKLTSLPEGIFNKLTGLMYLTLADNQLTTLPAGIFDGASPLYDLWLDGNQFSTLPMGIFKMKASFLTLRKLYLEDNAVDPLPLTVSLEKVGFNQFKAVAPAGAPFAIVLPLTVTNGSISGGATTITIPKGSVESQPLNVTRTSGTTAAVTVDIGTLPGLPNDHSGYALVKSTDLPLEVISGTTGEQTSTDFNGDGKTDFVDFFLFADAYGGTDARFDLDGSGTVDFVDFFQFVDAFDQPGQAKLLALAREMLGLPSETELRQNAPNPFNSETVISWFLVQPGTARLEVFALTGQRLAVLHRGPLPAGRHRIHWDGRDDAGRPLASGVYLYRLVSPGGVLTRKLTLLR